MMKSDYEQDVRSFLSDALAAWVPFFVRVVDIPLLQSPEQQFQGLVTLKIQVIRVSHGSSYDKNMKVLTNFMIDSDEDSV